MNLQGTLITIFETALVILAIWAVFHEDRFVALEERIFANIRRRKFKVIRGGSRVSKSYYPEKYRA